MQYSAWVLENAVLLTLTRLQQSGRFWQQNNTHTNVTVKTGTAGTGEPQMSHDGMVWRKHHFVFCVNVQNLLYINPAPGNDFLFYFKVATWLSLLGTLSCTSSCFLFCFVFTVYRKQERRTAMLLMLQSIYKHLLCIEGPPFNWKLITSQKSQALTPSISRKLIVDHINRYKQKEHVQNVNKVLV